MEPSSSTVGPFQVQPIVENQFYEDTALRRVLDLHLPQSIQSDISPDLSTFGASVLTPRILNYVADAEENPPFLRTWDTWGKRVDELITSEGWRELQDIGIAEGIVAIAYENKQGEYSRFYQFAKYHLWTGSCAYVTCPSAMTDGAARLLATHLSSRPLDATTRKVLKSAYDRLTSRDPSKAWTSGQWMTERPGGSDISNTETIATYSPLDATDHSLPQTGIDGSPLGPYSVSGFKWFSSATDSQMTIPLARTPSGISAFYAPMRRTVPSPSPSSSSSSSSAASEPTSELNGIRIQRLKSKLGTRALPTAELELSGLRAHILGTSGQGVREIATILNITRVHNAVTAVGLWGRALAISRAFARVRDMPSSGTLRGTSLEASPAHVKTMAKQSVEYRANMHLTFFVVRLLGLSEQPSQPHSHTQPQSSPSPSSPTPSLLPRTPQATSLLLRVLTPLTKALTAKSCIAALQESMASLGRTSYLDPSSDQLLNLSRLLRDANVLSIWEGTSDIMAADVVNVLKGRGGAEAMRVLEAWVVAGTPKAAAGLYREGARVREGWTAWKRQVEAAGAEELKARGREVMRGLGWVVCAVLLMADAGRDGDAVAGEVARRWVWGKLGAGAGGGGGWREVAEWDRRIVFGVGRGEREGEGEGPRL